MTLNQWEDKTNIFVGTHKTGAKWVCQTDISPKNTIHRQLWRLSDYVVSSITGGTIWLVKKEKKQCKHTIMV